jgi:hypothetical protein
MPPSPPFSHTSHTSTPTPSAAPASRTASSSASVSVTNRFSATTTGTPNFCTLRMWRRRLAAPRRVAATSGVARASFFTPPCIFRARTVATTMAASGFRPATRHLMSKNFSAPRSAPKPASDSTTSHSASARRVATMELQPWAMLPNGPQCTNAGPPSSVCTRLGWMASFRSRVIAPWAFKSLARTGRLSWVSPTMMRASRASRSARSLASARIAMISEPGMMTNRSSRAGPPFMPPRPTTMLRSARSFMSMVRGQVMRRVSSPRALPWCRCASSRAERRLWALAMAWKSPVKWRLMSSIGITCEYPPPHAPPFTPKTGPSDGSRMHSAALWPSCRRACVTPTVTVDLPSPAGVGLIPVTSTSRPRGWRRARALRSTFALYFPYSSISSSASPSSAAISATGRGRAAWAMAMSVGTWTAVTGILPGSEHAGHAGAEGVP